MYLPLGPSTVTTRVLMATLTIRKLVLVQVHTLYVVASLQFQFNHTPKVRFLISGSQAICKHTTLGHGQLLLGVDVLHFGGVGRSCVVVVERWFWGVVTIFALVVALVLCLEPKYRRFNRP